MKAKAVSKIQRIVAVDWSGRIDKTGQQRHIWAAIWTEGKKTVRLENKQTRDALISQLIALRHETPRMVVGVDFCFSYPAWFVREKGAKSAHEFWDIVAEGQGERWLGKKGIDDRFWGRPGKKNVHFSGEASERMFRIADKACKIRSQILNSELSDKIKGIAPKSPFQIGGAGAVGTGSLRGIPYLPQLRIEGFSVWPFDIPKMPLILEIYPRLLTGEVHKSRYEGRGDYLSKKQKEQSRYSALTEDVMAKARGSEDAFDALVSVMAMVEKRDSFLRLKQATDEVTLLEGAVWGAGE